MKNIHRFLSFVSKLVPNNGTPELPDKDQNTISWHKMELIESTTEKLAENITNKAKENNLARTLPDILTKRKLDELKSNPDIIDDTIKHAIKNDNKSLIRQLVIEGTINKYNVWDTCLLPSIQNSSHACLDYLLDNEHFQTIFNQNLPYSDTQKTPFETLSENPPLLIKISDRIAPWIWQMKPPNSEHPSYLLKLSQSTGKNLLLNDELFSKLADNYLPHFKERNPSSYPYGRFMRQLVDLQKNSSLTFSDIPLISDSEVFFGLTNTIASKRAFSLVPDSCKDRFSILSGAYQPFVTFLRSCSKENTQLLSTYPKIPDLASMIKHRTGSETCFDVLLSKISSQSISTKPSEFLPNDLEKELKDPFLKTSFVSSINRAALLNPNSKPIQQLKNISDSIFPDQQTRISISIPHTGLTPPKNDEQFLKVMVPSPLQSQVLNAFQNGELLISKTKETFTLTSTNTNTYILLSKLSYAQKRMNPEHESLDYSEIEDMLSKAHQEWEKDPNIYDHKLMDKLGTDFITCNGPEHPPTLDKHVKKHLLEIMSLNLDSDTRQELSRALNIDQKNALSPTMDSIEPELETDSTIKLDDLEAPYESPEAFKAPDNAVDMSSTVELDNKSVEDQLASLDAILERANS